MNINFIQSYTTTHHHHNNLLVMIPPFLTKKDPNTREVMADNLIKMLIEGPDVSFKGSPTVSPITAALCASECFLKMYLSSPSSSPNF
jgi:hypothetical protein